MLILVIFFWGLFVTLTGQNTNEVLYSEQCPYVNIFKLERSKVLTEKGIDIRDDFSFKPFDFGLKSNIDIAFNKLLHPKNKIKWEEKYQNNLKSNKVIYNACKCFQ